MPKLNQLLLASGAIQRQRAKSLSPSKVMTILIYFHQSNCRNFKAYFYKYVLINLRKEFPGLFSYPRFVEFIPSALFSLCAYLRLVCFGDCTGISFIDSTSLDACLNQRISSHKVFAGLAQIGKTSTGGSSVSNYIWSSMIAVKSSMSSLHQQILIIASQFHSW